MFDGPRRIALISDNELVVHGLKSMLASTEASVGVTKVGTVPETPTVDLTFIDVSLQDEKEARFVENVVSSPHSGAVVLFSWDLSPGLVTKALHLGCRGCFNKSVSGAELIAAVQRVHRGEIVVSQKLIGITAVPDETETLEEWRGQREGLSQREAEVIDLITRGYTNLEIAESCYLSVNTVKYYVRSAYRKIGVERRAQAVKWGLEYGMGIVREGPSLHPQDDPRGSMTPVS